MKYSLKTIIELSLDDVIKKFDSVENMKHWQKGFISFEPISDKQGEVGSKARLKYKMGNRETEMIETIIHKNLPYEFHATFETKGVFNTQENYFKKIDDSTTEWTSDSEFTFSGFMMKMMGVLMPGAFKKVSCNYMEDFKNFAEKGISVANE